MRRSDSGVGRAGSKRSALEGRFLALCRTAGLERPLVNEVVKGLEVDFLWAEHRLVVETDGFGSQATGHGFERDRRREAVLVRAGLRVLWFSQRQVSERPLEVVDTLRAAGVPARRQERLASPKRSG